MQLYAILHMITHYTDMKCMQWTINYNLGTQYVCYSLESFVYHLFLGLSPGMSEILHKSQFTLMSLSYLGVFTDSVKELQELVRSCWKQKASGCRLSVDTTLVYLGIKLRSEFFAGVYTPVELFLVLRDPVCSLYPPRFSSSGVSSNIGFKAVFFVSLHIKRNKRTMALQQHKCGAI